MVYDPAHRVGQPMRLRAASGRRRLADCPCRFEINVLIAHFSWPMKE
jgi:hypothetical protein